MTGHSAAGTRGDVLLQVTDVRVVLALEQRVVGRPDPAVDEKRRDDEDRNGVQKRDARHYECVDALTRPPEKRRFSNATRRRPT
jgi:hypothetical protein